jgi:glycosyltransferase involved in cell wall biosynthesis
MRIAIGYFWHPNIPSKNLEEALRSLGHTVTFVGVPSAWRAGYDSSVSIGDLLGNLPSTPDLFLWIESGMRYFPNGLEDSPIPTACVLSDVHIGSWREQVARFFDMVFISQIDYVTHYQHIVGHNQVYWLPHSIDPRVMHDLHLPRIYDVGFVGATGRSHRKTPRMRRLKLITERYTTNDVYRTAHQFYTHAEVAEVYSQSRIVVNTSIAGEVTMRILEGAGCGALVLTETRTEALGDMFVPGRDLVTYSNDTDLIELIDYYLAHEDERTRIAQAGHDRVHNCHTVAQRANTITETARSAGIQKLAPLRRANTRERAQARIDVYTHLHMLDAIFDTSRTAGYNPFHKLWVALPCLSRRLLF